MEESLGLLNGEELFSDSCPLSEDVLLIIVGFLPIKELLRARIVSKWWNAILRDPRFHQIRPSLCQEFATKAIAYTRTKYSDAEVETVSCSGDSVLLHGKSWDFGYTHHDIYVLQPANAYFRKLPQVVWHLPPERMQLKVKGIVVDKETKRYTVFVFCWESLAYVSFKYGRFGLLPDSSKMRRSQKQLYCYQSADDSWSLCGTDGLNPESMERRVEAIVVHRRRYTVMMSDLGDPTAQYTVLSCNNLGTWEPLPGSFPFSGSPEPSAFFENRGELYVAAVTGSGGCKGSSREFWEHRLWAYREDAMEWDLLLSHRFECQGVEVQCHETFLQRCGDLFHFGVFASDGDDRYAPHTDKTGATDTSETAAFSADADESAVKISGFSTKQNFRQKMVYNLATGKLEDLAGRLKCRSRDDLGVMVLRESTKALICLE